MKYYTVKHGASNIASAVRSYAKAKQIALDWSKKPYMSEQPWNTYPVEIFEFDDHLQTTKKVNPPFYVVTHRGNVLGGSETLKKAQRLAKDWAKSATLRGKVPVLITVNHEVIESYPTFPHR